LKIKAEYEVERFPQIVTIVYSNIRCCPHITSSRTGEVTVPVVDLKPTIEAPDDDPYLWLEETDNSQALAWVDAQNILTMSRFCNGTFAADRDALVRQIRAALLRLDTSQEPDWLLAITGNSTAAVGIAIRALHTMGMNNPVTDAVLSAVLCCALEGDHTARCVILSALRRRQSIDPHCKQLITAWSARRH
jgi:hypothetical protein